MITGALRISAHIWARHYRVPEGVYWLALLVGIAGTAGALFGGLYGDLFDGQLYDRQFVGGLTVAALNLIVIAVSGTGIVRWENDRRKARGGLVVPRFYETAGAKNRGRDGQLMVLDALDRVASEVPHARVHGIGAVVDLQHRAFAATLLRRLRASAVLHGRVVDRADGGWTVHARLALHMAHGLIHYDWHTSDATPGRRPWAALFSKLPSTYGVTDEEFPLELTRDLEAFVRATAGTVGIANSPEEVESGLRGALAASPDSNTPAMDVLRTQLALVVFVHGDREDEALDLLRERIGDRDAFGELLRVFAFLAGARRRQIHNELGLDGTGDDGTGDDQLEDLLPEEEENEEGDTDPEEHLTPKQAEMLRNAEQLLEQAEKLESRAEKMEGQAEKLYARALGEDFGNYEHYERRLRRLDEALREESIAALAAAADDATDPGRDISLYNLVNALLSAGTEADEMEKGNGDELREKAWKHLDELRERSAYYRQTWYVKRLCGLRAWMTFQRISAEHRAHSDEGIKAAHEAAKWYSAAIRARPRVRVMHYSDETLWRRYRLRSARSPILDANAFDAHFFAKHSIRAGYHQSRFQLRRRSLVRGAYRELMRGYVDLAYDQLDWTIVGRHRPELDRYDPVEAVVAAARDRAKRLQSEAPTLAVPEIDAETSASGGESAARTERV